jgi:hypothetical protein
VNLDFAGCEISVPHFSRSERGLTLDDDNRLLSERSCFRDLFCGGPLRVERDLDDSSAIAQIEEDKAPKISGAMHPAGKRDLLAGMLSAERAREMGSKRGLGRRIGGQSAASRRRDGNGLNLVMAYSWWKDRK